ncbi:hypothetical protein B0H12DRAFT_1131374 [Mycena haematopus]|nr:hypothetical protein B0H12DRAFT_1131374 [Mycena haematopus]
MAAEPTRQSNVSDLGTYDGTYWSPSMVKIADAQPTYFPSYQAQIFGNQWQQYDEPDPRKLRIWPALTVVDGVQCNDELLGLKDECVEDCSSQDRDVSTGEQEKKITESVPKLEQRIATHLLPDILLVNDCKNRTHSREAEEKPISAKYRRVYPPPTNPPNANVPPSTSHLTLPGSVPRIGQGSHADVYAAHLTLDERFRLVAQSTPQPATVRVAAKISSDDPDDLAMLEHEARIYNAFPEHLSEDWSGFNAISEAWSYDLHLLDVAPIVPVTAVVPKFYGYFVPDSEQLEEKSSNARPILLIEDCGSQIKPKSMSAEQRMFCFVFPHILHDQGFIQYSFYARNILVQPGPLTHPPDKRSLKTPSFRVIDFGRCKHRNKFLDQVGATKIQDKLWKTMFSSERETAEETLFGRRCRVALGRGNYFEGKSELERAYRAVRREWLLTAEYGNIEKWL